MIDRRALIAIAAAVLSACGSRTRLQVGHGLVSESSSNGASEPDAGAAGTGPVYSGSPLSNDASSQSLDGGDMLLVDSGSPPSDGASGQSQDGGDAGSAAGTYCTIAPWVNSPTAFATADGRATIPAGTYTLRYVSGAQLHDAKEGYEVTVHYVGANNIEAGHHLFNGATPETSSTSVWLTDTGLVGSLPTVADVEQENAGHTWSFVHAGGPLRVTYYDDYYGDNQGPGTRLCFDVSP